VELVRESEKLQIKFLQANAQGLVKDEEEITINIPAGARDGIQLNVRGKGNDAPFGGTPGDLLVIIEEEVDQTIKREGDNLHQDVCLLKLL
jgi:molecular chaperone DnaJ